MKKIMRLFVMTSVLLMGIVSIGICQKDYVERYVERAEGETFYVSFAGIYDGSQDVYLDLVKSGYREPRNRLGQVSAYALCCVSLEEEGVYWFGSYEKQGDGLYMFKYKLVVHLTIRPRSTFFVMSANDLRNTNVTFGVQQYCIQEEKFILEIEERC